MEKKINGCDGTCDFGEKNPKSSAINARDKFSKDSFYEKLSKLHESSGLSRVFNFREAILDLHLLYKEVTQRGGFHQVTKYGKWDEVASILNLKCSVSIQATELHTVYENLLHQFEQIYHYRVPKDANTRPGPSSYGDSRRCRIGKRKYCNSSSSLSTVCSGGPAEKKKSNNHPCQVSAVEQIQAMLLTTDKELIKDTDPPLKPRTGYQIFLRIACHRLKKTHGESSGSQNIRDMAIEAWRHLSEEDKLPYIDAFKMDRERYNREMAAYERGINYQNTKALKETHNDYYVSLQPDCENFLSPDEFSVELANQVMKNAQSKDPILQTYWNEFYDSLE
ncbi:High mobility group B protein 10 [Forsythia ovata]|uniref:High mobility group B protein 10 n=1 Tax=Forsythia ovata TaxID=205694 RepID=A0ABD1PXP3_9LAMI